MTWTGRCPLVVWAWRSVMRRLLVGMLVLALSATVIGHYTARFIKSEPSFSGSARIAFASSLTGPGQAGAAEMRRAAEAYANEVNAAGGIDGLKVEIVPFDDGNDAQRARSV